MHTLLMAAAAKSSSSSTSWIDLSALWKIVLVGLAAGAGLPALFAIGLRLMSRPRKISVGQDQSINNFGDDSLYQGNMAGLIAAAFCFAVCLAAIGWSVYEIKHAA